MPSPAAVSASVRSSTTASPSSACAAGAGGSIHSSSRPANAGELRASGSTAAQMSWRKPGSVSSAVRQPPPIESAASCPVTSRPASASLIAPASPFGPDPTTTARFNDLREARPFELVLDRQAVWTAEVRAHLLQELGPLTVRHCRERARRRVELEQRVSVDEHLVLESLDAQPPERRGREGAVPRRIALIAIVEVRAAEKLARGIRERRVRLPPVGRDERRAAARMQNARELRDRGCRVEPVERLADEDGVDASITERNRLRAAGEDLPVRDQGAHVVVRVDRDDTLEPPCQLARRQFERLLRAVEQRLRVRRANAVIRLRDATEAEPERPSRHRRAGTRGSPSASRARSRDAGSDSCPRRSA